MGGGGGINQHPACTAAPGIVGAGQLLPVTGEVGIMWAERASKDGEDAPPPQESDGTFLSFKGTRSRRSVQASPAQ